MGNYLYVLKKKQINQYIEIEDFVNKYKLLKPNRIIYNKIFLNNGYGNIHQTVKSFIKPKQINIFSWITI